MNEPVELRQQMWDLVYGLLEAEEQQALHARIKSDPQAARLYAEVRLQADLVSQAAKVDDVSVSLPEVEPRRVQPAVAARPKSRSAGAAKLPLSQRGLQWLAGVAASALAALIAVGLFWPVSTPLAAPQMVIVAQVPEPLAAQSEQRIEIETLDAVTKKGQPEVVRYRVSSPLGEAYEQVTQTNEEGKGEVVLPADRVVPGATLEFYAGYAIGLSREGAGETTPAQSVDKLTDGRSAEGGERPIGQLGDKLLEQPALVADLQVQPEPMRTLVRLDKEWYAPGETALIRAQQYGALTYRSNAAPEARYYLVGPGGELPAVEIAQADGGVVTGKIPIPDTAASGLYKIAVDNPSFGRREEVGQVVVGEELLSRSEAIHREGAEDPLLGTARDLTDKSLPRADADLAGKEASKARPDIGKLAASDVPPPPAPAGAAGGTVGGIPTPSPATLEPPAAGPATRSLAQREKSAEPGRRPSEDQLEAKDALAERGEEIEVIVPPSAAGKPVTVTAAVGERIVALQSLPPEDAVKKEGEGVRKAADEKQLAAYARKATLRLEPDVDGEEVTVSILDDSASPPKLVKQELLPLQSRRRVNVHFAELRDHYAPQEPVRFVVQVTDDQGLPVPNATLGLKVSEFEDFLKASLSATVRAKRFGIEEAEGLEQRERRQKLSSRMLSSARPGTDLRDEMPLAARGHAENGSQPADGLEPRNAQGAPAPTAPMAEPAAARLAESDEPEAAAPVNKVVFTNERQVLEALEREHADAAARQMAFRWKLGKALLVGAVVVLGLVVVLGWVQRGMPRLLWAPLLGVAAASLLVGFVWTLSSYRQSAELAAVRHEDEEHAAPTAETFDDVRSPAPDVAATDDAEQMQETAPPPVFAGDLNAEQGAGFAPAAPGVGSGGFGGGLGRSGSGAKETDERLMLRGGARGAEGPKAASDYVAPEAVQEKLGSSNARNKPARGLENRSRAVQEEEFRSDKAPREGQEAAKKEAKADGAASLPKSLNEPKYEVESADREPKMKAGLEMQRKGGGLNFGSPRSKSELFGLWQPVLTTDENGQAIIEFTMPEGEGDYRLVLDVQGSGRVGSLETLLRCEVPKPAGVPPAAEAKPNP